MITNYAALGRAFLHGETSPSAVMEHYLGTIARREPGVRAFVCLDPGRARAQAAAADLRWRNGAPLSPLDGMPIGVKDIIETADFPTGQGSPMWRGCETRRDAATVQALREAGAIVVGKTTTTEFASTELLEPTCNPHDPNRTPGGSSSGSAAACGAGMLPFALASQVVGSTTRPASFNGCIGYKPTTGGLNRGGSFDYLSQSCVGMLGMALEDVWLATRAIASRIGGDPGQVGVLGPDSLPAPMRPGRLALLDTDGMADATPGARAALAARLDALRAAGVEIADRRTCPLIEGLEQSLAGALDLAWEVLVWEMRWPLNTFSWRDDAAEGLSAAMKFRLAQGEAMTQADYAGALSRRETARARLRDVACAYDAVITLGAPGAAPASFVNTGNPAFNVPASLLGAPALSLPVLEDDGMPLGLQIFSGHGSDARLFGHAHWLLSGDAAAG